MKKSKSCVLVLSRNMCTNDIHKFKYPKKSVTPPSDKPKYNDSPERRKAYRVINTRRVWNFVEIVSFLVISMNNFKKRMKLDSVSLQSVFVLS